MRVLIACKRGNIDKRDIYGHCLCQDCKDYRYSVSKKNPTRSEYKKTWLKNNKEKSAAYTKKWNINNKEKRKGIVNSWRERNKDSVKLYNKKAGQKWAKNNKGKRNAIDRKRKTSLMNRTPSWANLEKIQLFYIESERLTKETGIPHEVDHIIPLQGKLVSGLHVHDNLQVITRTKNRSKKNKIDIICLS